MFLSEQRHTAFLVNRSPLVPPLRSFYRAPILSIHRVVHRAAKEIDVTSAHVTSKGAPSSDPGPQQKDRTMEPRLNPFKVAPDTVKAAQALEAHLAKSGLEQSVYHLVKTRASQMNGCAFCIHMHTQDARAHGETEERLYLLDAWRESPLYSERERAALAWTEALTRIAETRAPDEVYEQVRKHFSEAETVNLTLLIGMINLWNRFAISMRNVHPVTKPEAA